MVIEKSQESKVESSKILPLVGWLLLLTFNFQLSTLPTLAQGEFKARKIVSSTALELEAGGTNQNITLTHSGIATTVLGNSQVGIGGDGRVQAGTSFYNGPNNPILVGAVEISIIVESGTAYMWYKSQAGHINLATATNGLLDNWTDIAWDLFSGVNVINYTYVFKSGSTYYLLGNQQNSGIGDIYMYSSTNKTTWSIANGGNPVLHHSVTTTDWNYHLFNTTATVVGGTVHLFVEGMPLGGGGLYGSLAYSSSSVASLPNADFDTDLSVIFDGLVGEGMYFACPDLQYIPDRSALMAMIVFNSPSPRTIIYTALTSSNLKLPASWTAAKNFEFSHATINLADPDFVDLTGLGKTHSLMLAYNYNQGIAPDGGNWQAYSDLTLNQFYDAITDTASLFRAAANKVRFSGSEFAVYGEGMVKPVILYSPIDKALYLHPAGGILLSPDTLIGADNKNTYIAGGGGANSARGAFIHLAGNQAANAGRLILSAGSGENVVLGGTYLILPSGNAGLASSGDNAGLGRTDPFATWTITSPFAKTDVTPRNVWFVGSNEAQGSNPFGLSIYITGAAALANRSIIFQTTDWNSADGGNLILQSAAGNVGIGKTPSANTQLDVAKSIVSGVNTVTFSATPTFDASLGNTQKITLTDNVTSSTLSNATAGETVNFIICQDATGSRTFVWPANVLGGMAIGSTLSKCSAQNFIFDGTNAYALSAGVTNM